MKAHGVVPESLTFCCLHAALAVGLALVAPACQSQKSAICSHLEDLMDDEGAGSAYNQTLCEEQVHMTERDCSNFDQIAACWLDATSRAEFGACRGQCVSSGE